MDRRSLAVIGVAIATVLACPRDTSAGFVDFIYEMSGPQMVGVGTTCKMKDVRDDDDQDAIHRRFRCSLFGALDRLFGDSPIPAPDRPLRFDWAVQPAFYVSTKHNEEVTNSRRVYMLGVDPIVNYRSIILPGGFYLEHGVGVSVQRFFVPSADNFTRVALKLRLASIEVPLSGGWALSIAHNLRFYPDEVRSVDFGPGPRPDSRPSETVWKAFSVGIYPR